MCSLEEIELKKRIAQEKLQKKFGSPTKSNLETKNVGQFGAQKQPPFEHKAFNSKETNSPLKHNLQPNLEVHSFGQFGAQKASPSQPKRLNFKETTSPFKHKMKPYDKPKEKLFDKPKDSTQFYGNDKVITGKCSLATENRFVVELSGFSTPAVEIFKTISSKHYNVNTKNWDFHIRDHSELMGKLQTLRPSVVVEKLPSYVLNCLNREKADFSNIDLSKIDPELGAALMPFQLEGIRFGIDKNGRVLIADDMGLGKTFQALGIASYYTEDWPVLIVTTSSMKNVWEETIHKYLPSVPLRKIQYMTSGKDYIGDSKILIVSHDMMSRSLDNLLKKNFGVLIIDESHVIKNFKAKCTKAATALAKKADRVILLSGTPALSRPSELYSQLSLIDDKFFGNFFDYSKRYCEGKNTNFGWDASGKSNLQELEILLTRKFMIRRTKEDVLKTLPNKSQEIVSLDVNLQQFSEEDRKYLKALAEKYQSQKKSAEKHALLLTFFNETAKIKIPSVCSYILQVLKTQQKFLVFAHHQIMLDAIVKVLDKKNVLYIRIDGSTTSEQRKYFVDKFQSNDKFQVAVLSITAANAGITLTAAQLVLFAELHWNPSILSQAESRAHRIGQLNPVIIRYLLAPGTADDSIWPMLEEKQKILKEVGLSKDNFHNVTVRSQRSSKSEELTENFNITLNRTSANTLDISSYFKSPTKGNSGDTSDLFDDGLDDVFCNVDL